MAALAPPLIRSSAPMSASSPILPTISRPQSIKRRSTLKRSRDDSATMNPSSSPSKRTKVTFSPDVEVVSADDQDSDPLLIREQVRVAIQRHLSGDDDTYERVKAVFSKPTRSDSAPSTAVVKVHLQAVLANVSTLDKRCNGLVNAVLFAEWVGRDEEFCSLYTRFLINLAAAQTGYLGRITFALIDLLGSQKTRRIPGCRPVRQSLIHERVMHVIRHIIERVPVASGTLIQVIQKKLSMEFAKPEERIVYTRNFMLLIGIIPELKSEIIAMITSELVKLDVSVQVDLEDDDDDLSEELLQDVSSSQTLVAEASQLSLRTNQNAEDEYDDASTTDESDLDDDEDLDREALRRRKLKDNVRQVDALMDLLFQYYDDLVSSSLDVRESTITQIIAHFEDIILPTYRSRHSQFIIFHFAQTSPVTIDRFVTSCISILIEKKLPPVLRQSAAAYLAGFVGRGAHVSSQVVRDCFSMLCDELNDIRAAIEPRCTGPDLKRYSTFYATMQAILYIFCFRWRDLATTSSDMDDESDDDDEPSEQYHFSDTIRDTLSSAVHSSLNPLRICTPGIVEQFAKIANHLNFMYLYTKIEANKHVRLTTAAARNADFADRDTSWLGESGIMEGYFPYDPYQLPTSRRWLVGDYKEWAGIPGLHEGDSDSEEEDEEEDDDDDDMLDDDVEDTDENVD